MMIGVLSVVVSGCYRMQRQNTIHIRRRYGGRMRMQQRLHHLERSAIGGCPAKRETGGAARAAAAGPSLAIAASPACVASRASTACQSWRRIASSSTVIVQTMQIVFDCR